MDINDLTKYSSKWVALSGDRKRVLASSKSIKLLDKKINRMKKKNVIYHFVLPSKGYYIT